MKSPWFLRLYKHSRLRREVKQAKKQAKIDAIKNIVPLKELAPLSWKSATLRTLGLLGVFLLVPLLLMSLVMLIAGVKESAGLSEVFRNVLTAAGCLVAIINILHRYQLKGIMPDLITGIHVGRYGREDIPFLAKTLCAGLLAGLAVSALLALLPESMRASYDDVISSSFGSIGVYTAIFISVCMSPFLEEVMFRGIMLRSMLRGVPKLYTAITTSVLFGIMHWNPLWSVYAAAFGFLFAVITLREDNLIPAMLLHLGVNLSSVPGVLAEKWGWTVSAFGSPWFMVPVMLVCAAFSAFIILHLFFREYEGRLLLWAKRF
jgi:membrane protease YdiL (CAAX protease family)